MVPLHCARLKLRGKESIQATFSDMVYLIPQKLIHHPGFTGKRHVYSIHKINCSVTRQNMQSFPNILFATRWYSYFEGDVLTFWNTLEVFDPAIIKGQCRFVKQSRVAQSKV